MTACSTEAQVAGLAPLAFFLASPTGLTAGMGKLAAGETSSIREAGAGSGGVGSTRAGSGGTGSVSASGERMTGSIGTKAGSGETEAGSSAAGTLRSDIVPRAR